MDYFLLDTNLFISLNDISPRLWLTKLNAIKNEAVDIRFIISTQILGEMPFLRRRTRDEFLEIVQVDKVSGEDINQLKKKLDERNPAQDPDLTLLFLADKYSRKEGNAWLVSDDFKLVQNTQQLNNKINILTPGSFLLKLYTLSDEKYLKRYFKSMEKKVTDYSIKYILSRKDIYPAAKKLSWLIDRTASLIGTGGVDLSDENESTANLIKRKTEFISSSELDEDELMRLRRAELYISGEITLSKEELEPLKEDLDYIETLKAHVEKLTITKKNLLDNDTDAALESIEALDDEIISSCIKARFEYPNRYQFLYVITAIQVYKVTFFKAYISLLQDNIFKAVNYLTETAYWALQGHQDKALLNTVYMKAILFFFNFDDIPDFYRRAIENFEYARFLAEKMDDPALILKCLLGKAISSFMVEAIEDAQVFIGWVQDLSNKNPELAVDVFSEMADYFLIFGKPEYSVFLYDEALEAAVSSSMNHKIRGLLEKMKRSYIIAGIRMNEIVRGGLHLDNLIDESFELKGKEAVERYNEEIMALAQFNTLLYEPFPITYKSWTAYHDIDDELKGEFEVIDIEVLSKMKTRIVVYSSNLGLIAFSLPQVLDITGAAESYTVKLSNTANIKIRQVKGSLFEEKLIRALVYIKDANDLQVSKQVPAFLKIT
ncbi:hypothetical protein GF325_18085 [Candidatus Bathyarchaeota archaeon]|nr:hypothetical protein [Candidatus Bathyarchaeota archaeon]